MRRRFFLALAAAACAQPAAAQPSPGTTPPSGSSLKPTDLLGASGDANFLAWLNDFYARSLAAGWARAVLDKELSGLSPDPRVVAHDASQPEFARPVGDYVNADVTPGAVRLGVLKRQTVPELDKIARASGVPAEILVAIWGMESGFGASQGDFDVVRSFATLAAAGRRRGWAEDQLNACLKIINTGTATRSQLRGSWAGAMGQTQLLPATFLTTAVNASGTGKPDIWGSAADALASAAHLLAKAGWVTGQGWAREVSLRRGFDYGLSEGPKETPLWWAENGAIRADGGDWSAADAGAQAQLVLPSGAEGPAFLVFPNHFVIRTYNNSLAYALAVGLWADRLAGAAPLKTPWPHETPLSLTDRMDAQTALSKLGYNPGDVDGVVGLATRQALRAYQKARGLVADGYLSPAMVQRLRGELRGGSATGEKPAGATLSSAPRAAAHTSD
ncbi:MAG: peptidoglycan-binding protein [Caulobacteraceae bacterium]|nr:peptidoglycan-binding protein [Caulobacteraceae bacterium]